MRSLAALALLAASVSAQGIDWSPLGLDQAARQPERPILFYLWMDG